MGVGDRTVTVTLRARVGELIANVGAATKSFTGLSRELDQLGKTSPDKLNDVAVAAAGMGAALTAAFGFVVKSAMDFDKQMSEVGAVSGATAAQMDQLRQAALDAGQATMFSATEAAQAQAELAKAGLSTSEILGGALTGSLDLAAAGQLDLAQAADIAAKTMNVFKLEGRNVSHIADVLAAAANKSATDVKEMGEALKMGGMAASAAGVSLEETVGTLAAFADRALVGSDAGTSLKTTLMMLQAPSEKSAKLMKTLGINAYDASGNFIGMAKLAGVLQKQLSGMTQEQRNAALATIFGADAMRAANVLYELGEDGVRDYTAAVDDQGAAADVAAKKTDNLAGDLERLRGSIETLAIESGSGANGGLRLLAQGAERMVNAFAAIPGPVQTVLTVLAGVSGVGLLAAAGLVKVRQQGIEALEALSGMGPGGEKAAKGLGKAAAAAAKFAAVAAGAVVAIQAVGMAWAAFVDQPKETPLNELSKGLILFAQTGKAGAGTIDLFGPKLERLNRDLKALNNNKPDNFAHRWSAFVEGLSGTGDVDGTFLKAKSNIADIDAALAQLQSSGHSAEAAAAFARIAEEAKKGGVNVHELKAGLPQYQAALEGATGTQLKAIEVTEGNALSTALLSGSLTEAINILGTFEAVFDRFNGKALNVSDATMAAEASIDELAETLKRSKAGLDASGTSFDLNTEAGRRSQKALNDVARAAAATAQAVFDQTGDVSAAAATFNGYRDRMIAALVAMGMTAAQAKKLADEIMKIPTDIAIQITTKYVTTGTRPPDIRGSRSYASVNAEGSVTEYYARGGMRDTPHVAQIAPRGITRVWNEDEAGGEAYIPLAASKRSRSTAILTETNRRLGSPLGGGNYMTIIQAGANRPAPQTVHVRVDVAGRVRVDGTGVLEGLRDEVRILGGDVQTVLGRAA